MFLCDRECSVSSRSLVCVWLNISCELRAATARMNESLLHVLLCSIAFVNHQTSTRVGTVRAVVYGVHVRLNSLFSHDFSSFYVECMEQHALDGVNLEILFLF